MSVGTSVRAAGQRVDPVAWAASLAPDAIPAPFRDLVLDALARAQASRQQVLDQATAIRHLMQGVINTLVLAKRGESVMALNTDGILQGAGPALDTAVVAHHHDVAELARMLVAAGLAAP
jgi:hypothetical protein